MPKKLMIEWIVLRIIDSWFSRKLDPVKIIDTKISSESIKYMCSFQKNGKFLSRFVIYG